MKPIEIFHFCFFHVVIMDFLSICVSGYDPQMSFAAVPAS